MHADGVVVDPKCGLYHCFALLSLPTQLAVPLQSFKLQQPSFQQMSNLTGKKVRPMDSSFSVLLTFWFSCLVLFLFQLFHVILISPAPNTFCSLPVSVHCIKASSQYGDSTASVMEHHRKIFSQVKFYS